MSPYNTPLTLEGKWARLEPLRMAHAQELFEVAQNPEIWQWMPAPNPQSVDDVRAWMQDALDGQAKNQFLPFAIIDRPTNKAIGSTRYLEISPKDRHTEIGWTWLGKAYWRTPINTECKYLLLKHAFETLGAIRVQIKTDLRNVRSQNAIERIGGVREGTLRRVVIMYNGFQRSTAYFSILDDEWANVKAKLEARMNASP